MKLKIEGKLRDGFFEWLKGKEGISTWSYDELMDIHIEIHNLFENLPQSAQFGLLQEYADTLDIAVETQYFEMVDGDFCFWLNGHVSRGFKTRPEAQVAAIEKLNEIVNN